MTNNEKQPKKLQEALKGIVKLIQDNKIQQGDRLMPERELALELDASRATVREAIRRLEGVSVLSVKAGSGCYLNVPPTELNRLCETIFNRESRFDHLLALDTLEMVYPLLWPSIVKRATSSDHNALHEILIQFSRQVVLGDVGKTSEIDQRFHRFLSSLSGNTFLVDTIQSLMPVFQHYWNQVDTVDTFSTNTLFAGYVGILSSLKKNDISGMQHSFEQVVIQMKECLQQPKHSSHIHYTEV